MIVLTLDQRDSTHQPDAVPEILHSLSALPSELAFERTAGDEVQALFSCPGGALDALLLALRDGRFAVGIGVGDVDLPLPSSTREARGPAYTAAREAVETAKRRTTTPVAAVWHGDESRAQSGEGEMLDSLLWPVAYLASQRTEKQWAAVDAAEKAETQRQAAERLGISDQSMSRLLRDAHAAEVRAGLLGVSSLLGRLGEA